MTAQNLCAKENQPSYMANPVIVTLFVVLFVLIGCGGPSRGTVEYKIADPNKLARLATTDKDGEIRAAAVRNKNFTDQTLLAKIAVEDKYGWARKNASEKLTDPILLAKIAMEDTKAPPRAAAVKNDHFRDQTLLAKIAVEDTNEKVRKNAAHKLTDPILLAKIAVEDTNVGVRIIATKKVTDSTILAKIAMEDQNYQTRRAAANNVHLTDQNLLAKIAKADTHERVRTAAAKRITDPAYVERLKREGIICCHSFNITYVPNDGSRHTVHKICANSRQDCINQLSKYGLKAQFCNWNWQDCD